MDRTRQMFKRKVLELTEKLQARFPAKLMFVVPVVQAADAVELLENYIDRVHIPYGDKLQARDETFFMTTSDLDDPLQMVGLLRGMWQDMDARDRDAIWQYMDVFERLAQSAVSPPR